MARRPTPKKPASTGAVESTAEVQPVQMPPVKPEVEAVRTKQTIPDEEKVQLINVTLAVNTCTVPAGTGMAAIRVKPFQATPPMPKSWAEKVVGEGGRTDRGFENGAKGRFVGYHWRQWRLLAENGTPDKISWKEPANNKTYEVNTKRESGAVSPDGAPLIHSEHQALLFLRVAPDKETIRAFIDKIDGRPVVRLIAQDIMTLRDKEENERTQIQVVKRTRRIAPR